MSTERDHAASSPRGGLDSHFHHIEQATKRCDRNIAMSDRGIARAFASLAMDRHVIGFSRRRLAESQRLLSWIDNRS
jgi:hypothetical protein